MSNYSIYTLDEAHVSISNGAELSGYSQGDGSHLAGETITLTSNAWTVVDIADSGTDTAFADNDTSQTLNGAQSIYGTSYANGTIVEAEYTLTVEDPDGNQYTLIGFNLREPGAPNTYGTTEGLAFIGTFPPQNVPLTVVSTSEGPPNSGSSSTPSGTYATPPCFVAGTPIDTATGPRRIEDLAEGDPIWTADDGYQPLRLILTTRLDAAALRAQPSLRPVRIAAHAFAPGCPGTDLRVSQQHRILLEGWRAQLFSGEDQVLVAAKHLTDDHSIRIEPVSDPLCYYHLLFDRHQILRSAGLMSESFLPGPCALAAIGSGAQAEFRALFGDGGMPAASRVQSARPEVGGHVARLMIG